jgi:mycothiol synthase
VSLILRPFEERDYQRRAEISAAMEPSSGITAELLRHRDATKEPRIRVLRLVADDAQHGVIGWGQVQHIWWAYHPRRYQLRLEVDSARQRRGVGSALFDRLVGELCTWGPELVRADASADRPDATAFLSHRGFYEWRRKWDSILDVQRANLSALREADRRASTRGVRITTYAAALALRGDQLAHDVHEAEIEISRDEPSSEADAESMSFERFRTLEIDTPDSLSDAHFLAFVDGKLVGVSRLLRDLNDPRTLRQAFTGTLQDYRGQGIAQALKLRTIHFARTHGYANIRTGNDSANAAMLHINDAIGFERRSPIVTFERRFKQT